MDTGGMARRHTVSLLAALLLTRAHVADAECAWVLWSGATSPLAGYATEQECERARNDDHALAQRLSREYASPQALVCRPDREPAGTRDACGWKLWKFAIPARTSGTGALETSPIAVFETRDLCERQRSPDVMRRDERELTACLPETVGPVRPTDGRK
jgi:hypothetical protein